MATQVVNVAGGTLAFDDTGGDGSLVVMLPGAGDTRAEYRFVAPDLAARGMRVVTADLRGHGESSPQWPEYGMAETAGDLLALLEHLDAGPAAVVATSFSPAAALWAAAERPSAIDRLVLISAHLEAAPSWQAAPLRLLMRGPFAAKMWAAQFRKWHPAAPPTDLDEHVQSLSEMMSDPNRRRAVRETLTAHRDGLAERIDSVAVPTLVIMGGADSHFSDPATEGATISRETGGLLEVVPRAGHYPHVEFPRRVGAAIADFLADTRS